jgi:hypothetical protein
VAPSGKRREGNVDFLADVARGESLPADFVEAGIPAWEVGIPADAFCVGGPIFLELSGTGGTSGDFFQPQMEGWPEAASVWPRLASVWPVLASIWPLFGQFVSAWCLIGCEFWPHWGAEKHFRVFNVKTGKNARGRTGVA